MAQQYIENSSGIIFHDIDWSMDGHTLVDKAKVTGQGEGAQDSVLNPSRQGNPVARTMFGIDAINIDWDGAELELPDALGGTQIINTTGQLFRRL